jgi:hypothetical protein
MPDTQTLFAAVKDKLPKHVSLILSALFFVGTLLTNAAIQKTHYADQLQDQGARIAALEQTIKNDLATRREVDEVKATVIRIEDKLDTALGGQKR